jgi:outer membrane protein assembly factor BamC
LKESTARPLPRLGALALALALAGCGTTFSGDRVDYRAASAKINPLEVPPDLTQLSRDGRYTTNKGSISASSTAQATMVATASKPSVAPASLGAYKVERDAHRRWLSVPKPPEAIWQDVLNFWQDLGFAVVRKNADAGVIETDWLENRAKLPQDFIRKSLGGVLNTFYSTGELDQYRTRIERNADGGSDIFVTHKAMEEVYTNALKEATVWQPKAPDPHMEAEMLQRLMVKLGASEAMAQAAVANPVNAAPAPTSARVLTGQAGAALEVDDSLDRSWRRVGLALDRSGFTVEDRNRSTGLYYVRYVDPKTAGKDDSGNFLTRLFSKDSDSSAAAQRYQVALKGDGSKTVVSVLTAQGTPETGENGKRIITVLAEELK